jgi:hypothetical protein
MQNIGAELFHDQGLRTGIDGRPEPSGSGQTVAQGKEPAVGCLGVDVECQRDKEEVDDNEHAGLAESY